MIVYNGCFKLKMVPNTYTKDYRCLALNLTTDTITDEDILVSGDTSPKDTKCFAVESLLQVRKKFQKRIILTRVIALFFWILLCMVSWHTATAYYREGMVWYRFLLVGVCAAGALLYTTQAINPVAHDLGGKWINLRNGSTNLHGGTRIIKGHR